MAAPENLSLSETRGIDYRLYSLTRPTKEVVLRMYSGNFPSLFKLPVMATATLRGKAQVTDTTIRWQPAPSLRGRETLLRLGEGITYPEFMHVWYDSLNSPAAAEADSIIQTIRPEAAMPHEKEI